MHLSLHALIFSWVLSILLFSQWKQAHCSNIFLAAGTGEKKTRIAVKKREKKCATEHFDLSTERFFVIRNNFIFLSSFFAASGVSYFQCLIPKVVEKLLTVNVDSLDGLVEVISVEGCAQVGENALKVFDLHVALLRLVYGGEGLTQR